MTATDLKALAAHLQEEAATNAYCARRALQLGHHRTVDLHAARAKQQAHWAAGIEELAASRALAAVDALPMGGVPTGGASVGIEGPHDGLVQTAPAASPATFSPDC